MSDIETKLREALDGVTPGPWVAEMGGKGGWIKGATGEWCAMSCGDSHDSANANARYIALCSPDNIGALLDTIADLRKQVSDAVAWREITEDDRPPNDVEVLMGCWESWPRQQWVVEYGLYGSTKGGWIHGRMTHWLPSSILPVPPLATLTGGKADA
jgi:hypothetical protein